MLMGIVFVVLVCVVVPVLAIRSARAVESSHVKPTIAQVLASTVVLQGALAVLGYITARVNGITLFPPASLEWRDVLAGGVFLVLALLANSWRWRTTDDEHKERMSWLRPQSGRDVAAWGLISLVAGVCEELIYRGVLLGVVLGWLRQIPGLAGEGGYWAAVGICVLAFAVGHWVQGRGAMLVVLVFAAGFHVLVRVTGDLYTAMVVHVAYDFLAGMALWWLGRRAKTGR